MHEVKRMLYHSDIISFLETLNSEHLGKTEKRNSSISGMPATIERVAKHYKLTLESDRFNQSKRKLELGQYYKKIKFKNENLDLTIESLFLTGRSLHEFKADLDYFYTTGYSKKRTYYYRLIIPLDKKMDFHNIVEETIFSSDLVEWSRTGTKAIIDGDEMLAYNFSDEAKTRFFLGIESPSRLNFKSFSDKAFALLNAIGYLTGHLPGDSGYFFAFTGKRMEHHSYFYHSTLRSTIISSYNPINTNPYSYLRNNRKIADKYYKEKLLKEISFKELSILSEKLYRSIEFSAVILLILESSVASLIFMPGGYAIGLEALSDLVLDKQKLQLAPIKDKNKAKEIRSMFKDIIASQLAELESDDKKIINARIDNINSITNSARLKAPFEKLSIKLSKEDLKILDTRNDFLHGRIPDITNAGLGRNLERMNKDLYYASIRFYTLLNVLLLKWIGFDNYVLNFPKIHSKFCRIPLKEPFYRKV